MADLSEKLLQELLQTFRHEAAEHIDMMNSALLQFERATTTEDRQGHIQEAFRAAHSLKGAAQAVSMDSIQMLAHAMESIFQVVGNNGLALEASECDLLYDTLDIIQKLIVNPDTDIGSTLTRLQSIAENTNGAQPAATTKPQVIDYSSPTDETIRVSLDKLDDLMVEVGELLVSKISADQRLSDTRQITQLLQEWSKSWAVVKTVLKRHDDPGLTEVMIQHADLMQVVNDRFNALEHSTRQDVTRLEMVSESLQDKVRRVRMIPFSVHSLMFERVVRDTARVDDKQIQFSIVGADTEVDKRILESIKDSVIHLLRNAVVHGIERPQDRGQKAEQGHIELKITQRGSEVHIQISDDGRGFQLDRIEAAYRNRYQGDLDDSISMAFMPGVSTADSVDEFSGRGIGLDVVRKQLEDVHGRFSVHSQVGVGSTITLVVPTSLAITRMLTVTVNEHVYALPLMTVERIVVPDHITTVGSKPMLRTNDRNIPLATLASLLGLPETQAPEKQVALIILVGDQRLATLVDDVLHEQELAVKPIGYPVNHVRNITGAALLGSGAPIVVLNPSDFLQSYHSVARPLIVRRDTPHEQSQQHDQTRILVIDDSITTRTLERNILEAAGYNVFTATDGIEGLKLLQDKTVDVVVTDIEMPHINGFDLTRTIRDNIDLMHLPIILVTSLEREQDRERGLEAGADAYIVKRGFDQAELLATIERLVQKAYT